MTTVEIKGHGKFELPKGLVVRAFNHKGCAGTLALCNEYEQPGVIASVQTRSSIPEEKSNAEFARILREHGARHLG